MSEESRTGGDWECSREGLPVSSRNATREDAGVWPAIYGQRSWEWKQSLGTGNPRVVVI